MKLHIAIVNYFFPPRIGGAEKYCYEIAKNLTEQARVSVITSDEMCFSNGTPIPQLQKGSFDIHYLPHHNIAHYRLPKRKASFSILKKLKPDVVLINGPHPYSTLFGIYCKLLHIPIIETYQGDSNPTNPLLKIFTWLDRQTYRFIFNHIITSSPKYASRVAKFFPKKKITPVIMGLEKQYLETNYNKAEIRQELNLSSQKNYILFVAKLDKNHYYKGIQNYIETSKLLPNTHFLVVGDGEDLPKLKTQTQDQENITFLGRLSDEDIVKYYSAADIFVLPSSSSSEGFGLVLLEAAACSTPVITTSVVGSSDYIKSHNLGLIIPPESPTELKQAIEELLTDHSLYKKLQTNCQKTTQNLTWKTSAQNTYAVLEKFASSQS